MPNILVEVRRTVHVHLFLLCRVRSLIILSLSWTPSRVHILYGI